MNKAAIFRIFILIFFLNQTNAQDAVKIFAASIDMVTEKRELEYVITGSDFTSQGEQRFSYWVIAQLISEKPESPRNFSTDDGFFRINTDGTDCLETAYETGEKTMVDYNYYINTAEFAKTCIPFFWNYGKLSGSVDTSYLSQDGRYWIIQLRPGAEMNIHKIWIHKITFMPELLFIETLQKEFSIIKIRYY